MISTLKKCFEIYAIILLAGMEFIFPNTAVIAENAKGQVETNSTTQNTAAIFNDKINFEIIQQNPRQKRWGNYNGWYGNNNPPNFVPYVPNNNVAVGYPTAYGLNIGYIRQGNNGYGYGNNNNNENQPGLQKGFPVRCVNGGAHIGQCRLDDDAICMALGGTCINSVCCTTPFIGMFTQKPPTATQTSNIIDGEAIQPNPPKSSSSEGEDDESENKKQSNEIEAEKLNEIYEFSKILEFGRKAGLSTDSPVFAIFSGLFETTSTPDYSTVPGLSEWNQLTTTTTPITTFQSTTPSTTTTTIAPTTTTRRPSTFSWKKTRKSFLSTTTKLPVNSIESHSLEAEDYGPNDYTKKLCDNGLKPIGPCNDNGSCPVDHSCQRNDICCYDYALVALKKMFQNTN